MGIAFLLVARWSGPSKTAIVASVLGGLSVGTDVIDLGTSSWLQRELAARGEWLAELVHSVSSTKFWLSLVIAVPGVAATWALGAPAWSTLMFGWFVFTIQEQGLLAALRGSGRYGRVGLIAGMDRSVALLVMLIANALGVDPRLAFGLGLFVGAILAWMAAVASTPQRQMRWPDRITFLPIRKALPFGVSGFFSDIQLADTPVVVLVAGSRTGGLFALPARLTGPLNILATALTGVVMTEAASERGRNHPWAKLLGRLLVLVVVVYGATAAASWFLVTPVFGVAYAGARPAFVLMIAGAGIGAFNTVATTFLQARGSERFVAATVPCAMVAELLGLAAVAGTWGATGAGAVFLVTEALILCVFASRLRRAARHGSVT
jgi:O-antigen/teichoic acid export membrane protein